MFTVVEMKKCLLLLLCLLTSHKGLASDSNSGQTKGDAAFNRLADDYIAGYLAWRPQTGTALGFHEHDGKVTDFSRRSLDSELARLHKFDQQLGALNTNGLSTKAFYDYRILQNAIKREIFAFEEMGIYERNPMTYAGVLDINIYIKRDFAPLAQR